MKKIKLMIFFIFANLLCAFSLHASDESGDFLKNYGETVVLLNSINSSHVSSLLDCACYIQSQTQTSMNPLCPANSNQKPDFIKTGVNFYGEVFTRQFTCQNIVQMMVYGRLKSNYEEMRLAMGLMRSDVDYKASPELTETFGNLTYANDTKYKIRVSPKHDIKKMPWDEIPLKTPAAFSDDEVESMLTLYKEFGYQKCESFMSEDRDKIISKLHPKLQLIYQNMDNHKICADLIESNEKSRLKIDFWSVLKKMKDARDNEFRQDYQNSYAQLVQSNPLLTLVSSANPDLDEVIEALNYISSNAKKRLVESQDQMKEQDYLQFMQYSFADMYAKVIWQSKGLSSDNYSEKYEFYSKKFESKKFKKDMLIAGGLVGVTVACALPWGKGVSLALQFAKLSCLTGLGIPVNTYFFIDSIQMYNGAITSIFSHLESAYKMENSIDKLDDAKLNIGLSALFLPVGMGIAEGKSALKVLKSHKFN